MCDSHKKKKMFNNFHPSLGFVRVKNFNSYLCDLIFLKVVCSLKYSAIYTYNNCGSLAFKKMFIWIGENFENIYIF